MGPVLNAVIGSSGEEAGSTVGLDERAPATTATPAEERQGDEQGGSAPLPPLSSNQIDAR